MCLAMPSGHCRAMFRRIGPVCLILMCAVPAGAEIITVDFEDFSPGQVVAGTSTSGEAVGSNLFPWVAFSVESGGQKNSLLVFDSSNPTGGDLDLGTPNQDFGGPGRGSGGRQSTDGENSVALGNVLIIAENLTDVSPQDGLVDNPDDEARGGAITARFAFGVTVNRLTLLDIDDQSRGSSVRLFNEAGLLVDYPVPLLGDNSVQEIALDTYDGVTRMEIFFRGSGAVGGLEFQVIPTGVEETTWGKLKQRYR